MIQIDVSMSQIVNTQARSCVLDHSIAQMEDGEPEDNTTEEGQEQQTSSRSGSSPTSRIAVQKVYFRLLLVYLTT